MNKQATIWIIIAIVVLGGGAFLFFGNSPETNVPSDTNVTTPPPSPNPPTGSINEPPPATPPPPTPSVKTFTVSGQDYSFTPNTMTVKKGDTVRITFKNVGGMHDFKIDEFNVATKRVRGGEEETVEFVADKTGSFEYYCSVGSHRAFGMKGTLRVE